MKCTKCQNDLRENRERCPDCGAAVENDRGADVAVITPDPEETMLLKNPAPTGTVAVDLAKLESQNTYEVFNKLIENRYEATGVIGQGGFAIVLKARDKKLGDRTVAIKRLLKKHISGSGSTMIVERFRRESSVIATLNHRNIVTIYDCNADDEGDYIVMEYIDGGSLRQYIDDKKRIPVGEAVRIFRGICQGISFAHSKELIHRDLKPSNIMLFPEGGEMIPKIVDFGLARQGEASDVSITGMVMGTPYYMSPEQQRDVKNVNHATDIYSLGKILYELLTGDFPDVVDPDRLSLYPGIAEVIFKCLKLNPAARYSSAAEIIRDLDKVLEDAPAVRRVPPERFERVDAPSEPDSNLEEEEFFFREISKNAEELKSKNENSGVVAEYRKYIERYPSGSHRNEVEHLINEVRKQNYKGPMHGRSWRIPGTEMQFGSINPGDFYMGSNPGIMGIGGEKGRKGNEGPPHKVHLSYKFWMGRHPVTIGDYLKFMKSESRDPQIEWTAKRCPIEKAGKGADVDGGFWKDPSQPVVEVSWPAARAYGRWLTEIEINEGRMPSGGYVFRLPTEAEWEYCCRADSGTRFFFGEDERELGNFAWYDRNSRSMTHPVGTKQPNQWGLFDMLGNVWEWCSDHYETYKSESCINPCGPMTGTVFVRRGGSWINDVNHCRCAYRNYWEPASFFNYLGFRLVLAPEIGNLSSASRL